MLTDARATKIVLATVFSALLLGLASEMMAQQRRPSALREFLMLYRGKEILMMDKTGGVEQFAGGEAAKAYTVRLDDVLNDYLIVSRETENDKRSFVYPLSVIRRVIFLYDGKPYQKIVVETY